MQNSNPVRKDQNRAQHSPRGNGISKGQQNDQVAILMVLHC
jgi:hypothetical protein